MQRGVGEGREGAPPLRCLARECPSDGLHDGFSSFGSLGRLKSAHHLSADGTHATARFAGQWPKWHVQWSRADGGPASRHPNRNCTQSLRLHGRAVPCPSNRTCVVLLKATSQRISIANASQIRQRGRVWAYHEPHRQCRTAGQHHRNDFRVCPAHVLSLPPLRAPGASRPIKLVIAFN